MTHMFKFFFQISNVLLSIIKDLLEEIELLQRNTRWICLRLSPVGKRVEG